MSIQLYRAGFVSTDTHSELITLACDASTNNYDTGLQAGTNYQVPSGKVLVIGFFNQYTNSAGGSFYIGYGDTAVNDSAGAPTNPVIVTSPFVSAVANTFQPGNIIAKIPAGKYPFIQTAFARNFVTLVGVEVAA